MLTKTNFVLGKRCHKALHFKKYSPELESQDSTLALKLKRAGIEVGKYARSLYPSGVLIDSKDTDCCTERNSGKYIQRCFNNL